MQVNLLVPRVRSGGPVSLQFFSHEGEGIINIER